VGAAEQAGVWTDVSPLGVAKIQGPWRMVWVI
jgi:hypothetical protein